MKDYNPNISDQEIQYLLKCRLIEEVEDDSFTQKQLDMETYFINNSEAILLPSIAKENAFIQKFTEKKRFNYGSWKWIMVIAIAIVVISSIYFIYSNKNNYDKNRVVSSILSIQEMNDDTIKPTIPAFENIANNQQQKESNQTVQIVTQIDSLNKQKKETWILDNGGINAPYQMAKHRPSEPYDNYNDFVFPILSKVQIKENNKQKEKMIKQLLKKDKTAWAYIPMSTDVFNGEPISLNSFYVATAEVTNKQYHIFLNDLLIQGLTDEYIKSIPDTTKWNMKGSTSNQPMVDKYFWHPAYNDYPVVNISREAAKQYCNWLTKAVNDKIIEMYKMTSNGAGQDIPKNIYIDDLRLPMDVEWMLAARAGLLTQPDFPWGTNQIQNIKGCFLCNFGRIRVTDQFDSSNICNDESESRVKSGLPFVGSRVSDGAFHTAKVKSYNPNNYNLYCMSGNVAEMIWQNKTKKPGTKGGSWNSDADHVKINGGDEYEGIIDASPFIGFRPVFTATNK